MKNFLFYVLALLAFCIGCKSGSKESSSKDSLSQSASETSLAGAMALDSTGISETDAGELVAPFRQNTGFYKKSDKASCWFSKDYIYRLDSALRNLQNKLDGIRVYLAFNQKDGYTFIIVPTNANGQYKPRAEKCNPNPALLTVHKDNFNVSLPRSKFAAHIGLDEYGNDPGATLFEENGCPVSGYGVALGLDTSHVIKCEDANDWVKNRVRVAVFDSDKVNTFSEWFEPKFISDLKKEFKDADGTADEKDGVRLYLARKKKDDCYKKKRHVFLWVTTKLNKNKASKATHIDDYEQLTKWVSVKDNGEQCLNNCHGATLQ